MKKGKIEKVIKNYVQKNHKSDPGAFPKIIPELGTIARILADEYWETRKKSEVKRDKEAGVTIKDYENWVLAEMMELKKAELYN